MLYDQKWSDSKIAAAMGCDVNSVFRLAEAGEAAAMAALGADCGAEGSGGVKIPDDVFTTRCRYCGHGQTGAENKEIPDDKLFIHFWAKQSPCGIIGIAQCDKVQGECLDFKPNPMLEFANTALSQTVFIPDFCTAPSAGEQAAGIPGVERNRGLLLCPRAFHL